MTKPGKGKDGNKEPSIQLSEYTTGDSVETRVGTVYLTRRGETQNMPELVFREWLHTERRIVGNNDSKISALR